MSLSTYMLVQLKIQRKLQIFKFGVLTNVKCLNCNIIGFCNLSSNTDVLEWIELWKKNNNGETQERQLFSCYATTKNKKPAKTHTASEMGTCAHGGRFAKKLS